MSPPHSPDIGGCEDNIVEMIDMDEENLALSRWVVQSCFKVIREKSKLSIKSGLDYDRWSWSQDTRPCKQIAIQGAIQLFKNILTLWSQVFQVKCKWGFTRSNPENSALTSEFL